MEDISIKKFLWIYLKNRLRHPFLKNKLSDLQPNVFFGYTDHPLDVQGTPISTMFNAISKLMRKKSKFIFRIELRERQDNSFIFLAKAYNIFKIFEYLKLAENLTDLSEYGINAETKFTECTLQLDFLRSDVYRVRLSEGSKVPENLTPMIVKDINDPILEVQFKGERPSPEAISQKLADLDLGLNPPQPSGEKGVILRMENISEETHQNVFRKLGELGELEELRFEAIGPVIGRELKAKTKVVATLALLAVLIYIIFAFHRVSKPVPSWQYGIAAILALFHDALIPLGVFAVLGKFYGVQFTIPVVTALLAVIGYSINDSVVVFDRIRENLIKRIGVDFEQTVNISLNQTLVRSINTSLTTLLVLFAIFFFGGESLTYFALALIIGVFCGTYSSIFLASPLLAWWYNRRRF